MFVLVSNVYYEIYFISEQTSPLFSPNTAVRILEHPGEACDPDVG